MFRKFTICALLVLCMNAVRSQVAVITAKSQTYCSASPFTITPTDGVNGDQIFATTTYSWAAPSVSNVLLTGGASGAAASSITGTLTNGTSTQQIATYTVIPFTAGFGNGAAFTVTITVNPYATAADITITPANPVICGGLTTSLSSALSVSSTISNPNFTWYSNASLTTQLGTGSTYTTTTLNATTTFYVKVSGTNACANQSNNGQSVTVTVSGVAPDVVQPSDQTVCAGLTSTTTVNFTSLYSPGTIYNWTNSASGIGIPLSGTGDISSFTAVNNTNALITATITVTPYTSTNSCYGASKSFKFFIGPKIANVADQAITTCSGVGLNFSPTGLPAGSNYTWNMNGSLPAGLQATGTNTVVVGQTSFNPTLYLTAGTLTPVDVVFITTPKTTGTASCPGNSFSITVTVKPTPSVSNQITTSCSGSAFTISPTGVPSGTLYTWGVPSGTGSYSGSSSQASQQTVISQTITNTGDGTTNAIIKYNITPKTSAGCVGTAFSGTVTVYPKPTLTNGSPVTLCNKVLFNFTPNTLTTGTTYTWTRAAVNNISNTAASGSTSISETLANTGTNNEIVTYQITGTANGCSNTQNLQVTVKPTLNLSSDLTKSSCSNAVFAYVGTSATTGTVLNWTRTTVAGITAPVTNTGNSSVNERLVNTTNLPIDVIYQYGNTSGSCTDITNVRVTVNPVPSVNSVANQIICSGVSSTIPLTGSSVTSTTYNWVNSNTYIGLTSSGSGDISYLSYNATYSPIAGNITVTPTAYGCNGTTMSFSITVNPSPTLSSSLTIPAVCSGAVTVYSPTGNVSNTSYAWTRQTVTGIDNAAGSGNGRVADTLINSSNVPLQVPYNYTLTANGCSNTQLVNVTVNPVPTMFNPGNQLACNNTTKVINFSGSIVSGTGYFWSNDNTSIGVAAAGTGDIFFVANTTSPDSVYANIVAYPKAYDCAGPQVSFKIIVNPPLSLSSTLTPPAICSNALFGYTPASLAANPIYVWNRNAVNGVSNSPASGSGTIQEILINTTSSPVNVTYDFTLSSNGCVKNQSVVVQVNPALVLSNANVANEICSGTPFTFSPIANITGVPYLWTRAAVTGISNAASNGVGDINESLINTTTSPIEVIYKYALSQGATCAADQLVKVTVKPIPNLTGNKTIGACSNTPVAYTPVANIPGTNFNWSRAFVPGISNTSAVGLVGISESLINTTTASINVLYNYNLTNYNGCTNTELVTVQVKPSPIVGTVADQSICADDVTKPIVFTSNIANTTFNWINSEPGIGLAASGSGLSIPSFKSINTSSGQLVGIIQVNPVVNGCTGNPVIVTRITVNRAITTSFIETQPGIACPGQLVGPFIASIPLGGDGSTYLFQWQVSTDSLTFANIPGATSRQLIAPAITKNAWYRMNTVSLGCSAVTPLAKVVLKAKPVIVLDNRDNYTVSIGNSTQVYASGASTYLWSPAATVSDFRSSSPLLTPLVDTKYKVIGTTEDGCSDSAVFTVKVVTGYKIYPNNILTPNGDGYNDTWKVKNIEYYPDNSVKVYNVNSVLVRELPNYKGDWDGTTTGGLKLPSGTYYYIITLKSGEALEKGYLTILN